MFVPTITRKIVVDTSAQVAGTDFHVPLDTLPKQLNGRPLHIKSITLRATAQHDEAGGGPVIPGEFFNAVFSNIELWSGDHYFVKQLDGDEVNKLGELRRGAALYAPADQDTSGAAAANQTTTPEVTIQCATGGPTSVARAGTDLDGVIPVALLDSRNGGGLKFTVASTIIGAATVTVDQISNLEVFVELVALDQLRLPTAWSMRAYDEKQKSMAIRTVGRVLSCLIRNRKDSQNAVEDPDHSGYAGLKLQLDDLVLYSGRSIADVVRMWNQSQARGDLPALDTAAPSYIPIFVAQPGEKRSKMASADIIRFEADTVADSGAGALDTSRILIHETGRINHGHKMHDFLARMGAPRLAGDPTRTSAAMDPRFANRDGRSASHPLADVLDAQVFWHGMSREGYSVPEKKLRAGHIAGARK